LGIYPAVDPLDSTKNSLLPAIMGIISIMIIITKVKKHPVWYKNYRILLQYGLDKD